MKRYISCLLEYQHGYHRLQRYVILHTHWKWSKMILILFLNLHYKKASDTIANSPSIIDEVYAKQGLKGLMQIGPIRKVIELKI